MRRVMVGGQPGSGKSTFARALGARASLPVIRIDPIPWGPGWVGRPGEAWVFEGDAPTWESRVARAYLVLPLDRPSALRFWGVVRGTLRWIDRSRPEMPPNRHERFGRQAWWLWHFLRGTHHTARDRMARLSATAPCPVVRPGPARAVTALLDAAPTARLTAAEASDAAP